ncbi:S9 family peptidase [Microbacterium sp. JB110]|uniref:S9 family peptidase n=1 Tax=Microbacterium sp. JB110 TaxID=2024477 RepID=UPI00097EA4DB|nr:S9 family peptidase [Microbacterium sp. JB110]RCS59077.1 S9 family peptidase [Microbacterium sp. JB110]SJM68645.1 Protease II [Frigoribacterium sp. JB110]
MTSAPSADRRPTSRAHHGHTFDDPYEWLRAKDDPEVIAHLEAENAHTDAALSHLAPVRERIFDEIRSRVKESDLSVPSRRGQWWYYGRTVAGKQYGIQCRAPLASPDDWTPPVLSPDADVPGEQVLLDANVEADGKDFFSLGSFDVSDDGTRMLWAVDEAGDERYTIRIKDLTTGELLPDTIAETFGGAQFLPDGEHIVYSTVDDAWRPHQVWLHSVGEADAANDVELYGDDDERFWVGAGVTRSDRFLVMESGSSVTSEVSIVDASDPQAAPAVVWPRRDGVEYGVDHAVIDGEDWLYILHNDGALDFELVRARVDDPSATEVVLGHEPGRRLIDVDCFRDFAVVEYRSDGLPRVGVLDYGTGELSEIEFPDPLYSAGATGNPEWAPPVIRVAYGSFTTPGSLYEYELATGELLLRKRAEVLGGYDAAEYDQRRVWVTAADGTRIPVSLVWKRSFGEPGSSARPVHLYGYGSYEHSIDPGFSVARLSELDRGILFAVAHVRGGGEMGRQWYESGKTLAKRNTFTDFVDVARFLSDEGYTSPDRIVAEGGSAGGLLMGAVANMAPDAFAGILADVPFVDALTSILDPSLPLTVIEWDEWGDPLHDADVYEYMKSYSPYENVREGVDYPRVLAMTSLNDTRVLYVEPAKWVQRLREVGADVLMKCEMNAGHGGVTGRYNSWRERAYQLAWLFDVLGVSEA